MKDVKSDKRSYIIICECNVMCEIACISKLLLKSGNFEGILLQCFKILLYFSRFKYHLTII